METEDVLCSLDLKPSSELISYYKNIIKNTEKDYNEINGQILKLEEISSHQKCEEERERLLQDLLELRETLSDVNVYVHCERQQLYKLTSEKEILKVDNILYQRKLEVLLDLLNVSEEELDIFLRNAKGKQVLSQKCRSKLKFTKEKLTGYSHKIKPVEELALEQKCECIRKQFEESKASWEKEKIALYEDRDLCKQELRTLQSQNASHMRLIDARLNVAKAALISANKKYVRSRKDFHITEHKWRTERDKITSNIGRNMIGLDGHVEDFGKTRSFTDHSDNEYTCKVQLKREMNTLKKQLRQEEELGSLHEERWLKAQHEVSKLKAQNAAIMVSFKTKVKKLQERIDLQEKQKEKLIHFKTKQHEGYLSENNIIKQQMKTVVHQLFKLTSYCNKNGVVLDSEALSEVKSVASLVRKVHHSILESRKRLIGVNLNVGI